jgi:hypothetical protein
VLVNGRRDELEHDVDSVREERKPSTWTGRGGIDEPVTTCHRSRVEASDTSALLEQLARQIAEAVRTGGAGVPRLALKTDEACAALGVSRDFFDEHIGPELRWIQRGRLKLVYVRELERWLDRSGEIDLERRRRGAR